MREMKGRHEILYVFFAVKPMILVDIAIEVIGLDPDTADLG